MNPICCRTDFSIVLPGEEWPPGWLMSTWDMLFRIRNKEFLGLLKTFLKISIHLSCFRV